MPSQTIENYLKAAFNLANDEDEINISDLAASLEVSLPTANSMVKKLADLNFLRYARYKPLIITQLGKKEAALIIRKHRLTEMFLVEKMGFGWEEVHDIAEQVEHVKSPLFFNRMDELLGFPAVDPHGSPIPDKQGIIIQPKWQCLANCNKGDKVVLRALENPSDAFLKYLNSKELQLGLIIDIVAKEAFDNSLTIAYANRKEVLSTQVTEKLLVGIL